MIVIDARIVNYDRNCSFIVLATVITIVNYDRKTFIVQATGCGATYDCHSDGYRSVIYATRVHL
jgi:hypothetical protein